MGEGGGRLVGQKLPGLLGRWRQARQIVGGAANQGLAVGRRRGHEAAGCPLPLEQGVDVAARERRPGREGLERPPRPGFVARHPADGIVARPWIGRAHRHPAGEDVDFVGGHLPPLVLGRHLQGAVVDRFDQQALVRPSGHDRRTAVAPLLPAAHRGQRQTALGLRASVASEAAFRQQRPDVLLEKLELGGWRGISGRNERFRSRQPQQSGGNRQCAQPHRDCLRITRVDGPAFGPHPIPSTYFLRKFCRLR